MDKTTKATFDELRSSDGNVRYNGTHKSSGWTMSVEAHLRTRAIMAAVVLLFFAATPLMGQSGRRPPKRVEVSPPPTPTPEPTPQINPPAKAQFALKVVSDIPLTVNLLFPFPERMQTWTVGRLTRSPILDVTEGAPAKRHEAVRLAKAETEAFIVWLQLEDNQLAPAENVGRRAVLGEVWINFSVFAPRTGKARYSGRVVLGQAYTRRVGSVSVVQTCYPGVRGDDFLLLEASLEVAARILNSLDVSVPPVCP